jgi:hypothetical protein
MGDSGHSSVAMAAEFRTEAVEDRQVVSTV